ncbi:two-component system signal transduction histidine kinase [Gottschalkia purinilytica]|uniref:histidine kinase n=1 Tax=Gottschalkia purinilytica TaxID=1503 RepID=A0A0L0W8R6_GOTPU|nr:sensor histidine kinase [Gottschalkia purinilytica]KNF07953.1 two-component system signal transduction histidine kinase [Gottschalkia purinilytica]
MDIRSKNKYIYLFAFIVAIYILALALLTAWDFNKYKYYFSDDFHENSQIISNSLYEYKENLMKLLITFNDYENKIPDSKVNDIEINNIKNKHEQTLLDQMAAIKNQYDERIDSEYEFGNISLSIEIYDEMIKKLKEFKSQNTKSMEDFKHEAIINKDDKYKKTIKYIDNRANIKYYFVDNTSKKTYTNIENITDVNEYIKKFALYSEKISHKDIINKYNYSGEFINKHELEGYIIIPKKANGYSQIHEDIKYMKNVKERLGKERIIFIVSSIIGLTIIGVIIKNKGLKFPKFIRNVSNICSKFPIELRVALLFIYTLITIVYIDAVKFFYFPLGVGHIITLTFIAIYVTYIIINISGALKLFKNKNELRLQLKKGLIYRGVIYIKEGIINIKDSVQIQSPFFRLCIIIAFNASVFMFMSILIFYFVNKSTKLTLFLLLIVVAYFPLTLSYILKKIGSINKIIQGVEEISYGNLNYEVKVRDKGRLSNVAYNLNNMRDGFKKSLEEQIKSERLKTELITNVSHDLKTPLTSIINYIDLLKNNNLSKDELEGYIGVLDRKSQRLKILIDDLFEAAKLSSGEVKLDIQKVDVVALLNQAMGELNEKIKKSHLTFRVNTSKQNMYANLDGKKTWRVFENLLCNILKYSQPNTRVFIDIIEENKKVIIIMKNTSAYELDFNVEEIFERFKRGDKSRTTEGSGLGLAIAKSIVELQGGKLDIKIDGDLFKVIIEFYND